jgi:hypothetical protein
MILRFYFWEWNVEENTQKKDRLRKIGRRSNRRLRITAKVKGGFMLIIVTTMSSSSSSSSSSYPPPIFHHQLRVLSSHYHLVQRHMLTRISGLSSRQAGCVISVAINTGQLNIDRRSAPVFGQQMSRYHRKLTSSTIELTETNVAAPAVRSSLPPGQ